MLEAAFQCINVFFAEARHNKSIESAHFNLKADEGVSMDDLIQLIQDNQTLKYLMLKYSYGYEHNQQIQMPIEECTALSRAIQSAQLESFDVRWCKFGSNRSFQQIMEGCSRAKKLLVTCKNNSQCSAVSFAAGSRKCAKMSRSNLGPASFRR